NDLWEIHNTMGFWIHITAPTVFTVNGIQPASVSIPLVVGGMNMVGYPVPDGHPPYTIEMFKADYGVIHKVEGFNGSHPYRISELPDSYVFQRGEGYLIYVVADINWLVYW
ncbi:MAG: hypothetical protein KAX31_03805, partial [Thermoplasmata archaeon]|nr:hypothetical protein [Thermoplasmata archaeon]